MLGIRRCVQFATSVASRLPVAARKVNVGAVSSQFHTMTLSSSAGKYLLEASKQGVRSSPLARNIVVRGFKNPKAPRSLKTRQSAAKRLTRTGSGKIKHGHGGKAHLNRKKSSTRLARLSKKGYLTGVTFRNMSKLLMTGK